MPSSESLEEAKEEPTISSIVAGQGEGRRSFALLAWLFGSIAVISVALAALQPTLWPPNLAELAKKVAQLPADAKVEKVVLGPENGTGEIWFRLGEPAGAGSRQGEVWSLNSLPSMAYPAGAPGKSRSVKGSKAVPAKRIATTAPARGRYTFDDGRVKRTLSYDAKARLYHLQFVENP